MKTKFAAPGRFLHAFLGVILALGIALQPNGDAFGQEKTRIKVAILPYLSFAPFFVALQEDYFAEQQLEVELVDLSPREIIPAVALGQVDVSAGLVSAALLNTIAKGGNLRIVADKGYIDPAAGCPIIALVARPSLVDSGELDKPGGFAGRNINVWPASWLEYYLEKTLATAGLVLGDMTLKVVPVQARQDALEKGSLDLTVANEPWVTRFRNAGNKMVLAPVEEVMPESQYAVTLYGPNFLEKDRDAGRRFMVAYLKAVRQYNEGKTERNIRALASNTRLDPPFLQQVCWPALRSDGQIDVDSVLDFQSWALRKGLVDEALSEMQFWDPSFVEHAARRLDSGQ